VSGTHHAAADRRPGGVPGPRRPECSHAQEDAYLLLPSVREVLPTVRSLIAHARDAGVDVNDVNDN
jgi:hypothetical protein